GNNRRLPWRAGCGCGTPNRPLEGEASMRTTRLASLVILGLLLLGSGPVFGQAPALSRPFKLKGLKNHAEARNQSETAPEKNPTWEVKGWAEKREDAERFALEEAQQVVVKHFADRRISLDWVPSTDYINQKLV